MYGGKIMDMDFLMSFSGLLPYVIFFLFIILVSYVRSVPPNTVQIIDRNTHYLKTKRHGFYFFNPNTDKITTEISKRHLYKRYTNTFETHDGYYVDVTFEVEYHAENLDAVLEALALVRRSVDDVMNGSMYWGTKNFSLSDIKNLPRVLENEAKSILISEAGELELTVDRFYVTSVYPSSTSEDKVFKPHSNSYSSGPIKFM